MKTVTIVTLVLLFSLCGCAKTKPPQNHYYLLNPPQNQQGELNTTPPTLRIELAQFLSQGSLVLQLDEQRIQPCHYHRWAEPLAGMIERYLQRQLQQHDQSREKVATTLVIDRFHGSPTGEVWLSGQWWDDSPENTRPHRFAYQAKQQQAGYDSLVITLQQLLDRVANKLAE